MCLSYPESENVSSHLIQVIVEVCIPRTQVSTQKGGVRRENGCYGDLP